MDYTVDMSNPIDVQSLQSLRDGQRGMVWLQGLARSNVRRSAGGVAERAYDLAGRIHAVEEEIQTTHTPDKFAFPLPPGWWIWVIIVYFSTIAFAKLQADGDMRILVWMWCLVAFGVFAIVFLAKKYGKESALTMEKRRRRARLKGERAALMVDLLQTRDALVQSVSTLPPEPEA